MKAKLLVLSFMIILGNGYSYAASDDECAIWLCLPGDFPSGCGGAHSAMIDRVKDRKSPLPSFSSCSVDDAGDDTMSSRDGRAAEMYDGSYLKNQTCHWVTVGTGGDRYSYRYPRGCVATGYYAEVYLEGEQLGNTYYFTP